MFFTCSLFQKVFVIWSEIKNYKLRITFCKRISPSRIQPLSSPWPPFLFDLSGAARFSPIPEINRDCVPDYCGFTLLNVCISSSIYFPFWYAWNGRKTADSESRCYKLVTMFLQMDRNAMIWVDVRCNETLIKRFRKWFPKFNVPRHRWEKLFQLKYWIEQG